MTQNVLQYCVDEKELLNGGNAMANPYVIIAGCGKVGEKIVHVLNAENFSIAVIDWNAQRINDLVNQYDILGIVGNGASEEALTNADVESADLFIAVSPSDEFNLLCCALVKAMKDIPTIARVRTPVYTESVHLIKKALGTTMIINPELETAMESSRILSLPAAYDVTLLAGGKAELVKFKMPENNRFSGKSISEIDNAIPGDFIIAAIHRSNDEVYIPNGDFVLEPRDHVSLIASKKMVRTFFKEMRIENEKVKNCMIIGGGRSSYFLAKELIKNRINVKIIEKDLIKCHRLSDKLPEAIIIHGDGANEGLLLEEGLTDTQGFVAFTGIDEENVILALHAQANSNAKVIFKLDRGSFKQTLKDLHAGTTLSPRDITTEAIVAYARAMKSASGSKIETLYHMYDERVEVLEFSIDQETRVTNIPLKDLPIKDGTVIGFIRRGEQFIVPKGNDCIMQGDTVLIVTINLQFSEIDDILKK